jgi:hypothetical protein
MYCRKVSARLSAPAGRESRHKNIITGKKFFTAVILPKGYGFGKGIRFFLRFFRFLFYQRPGYFEIGALPAAPETGERRGS